MKNYVRLLCAMMLLLCPFTLQAVERHAFVVGNSNYGGDMSLINPVNDASDMAAELKNLGYQIYSGSPLFDLGRAEFEQQLSTFALQLPPDSVALVYYAGHGIGTRFDNYLLPVGASVVHEEFLPDRATSLRSIVNLLNVSNEGGFNIILLDACRDNPLGSSRGLSRGLKTFGTVPRGTFIGYAAAEGQAADDGQGRRNGVYTGELIKALKTQPDQPIEIVHKGVSQRVLQITKDKQFPVSDQRFVGEYCFAVCGEVAPLVMSPASLTPKLVESPTPKTASADMQFKPWMAVAAGAVILGAIALSAGGDGGSPGHSIILDPP